VRATFLWFSRELSSQDQEFIRRAADLLNAELDAAADRVGVHFVDVADRFAGHEVCSGDAWIFGIDLHGLPLPWNEDFVQPRSFHPTSSGQVAYADALNAYVNDKVENGWGPGFHLNGLPKNPAASAQAFAAAAAEPPVPGLGPLAVEAATPPPCAAGGAYVRGQAIRVRGSGFAAGEAPVVRFRPSSGTGPVTLATPTVNAEGRLDAVVTIPVDAPHPDVAIVEALGAGPAGVGHLLSELVGIGESFTADADSDGVPDVCDSCPLAGQAAQTDTDGDGTGDVCDPCPQDDEDRCAPPSATTTTTLGALLATTTTTTTTLPAPACTSDAACADTDACTTDTCDPVRGCRHDDAAAGTRAAVSCVVSNGRAILAESPQPVCTKRCPRQLAKGLAAVEKAMAKAASVTKRRACLKHAGTARRNAAAFQKLVSRLARKAQLSPPGRGERLRTEAGRLLGRVESFVRDGCPD
jgi:hypothetical protein